MNNGEWDFLELSRPKFSSFMESVSIGKSVGLFLYKLIIFYSIIFLRSILCEVCLLGSLVVDTYTYALFSSGLIVSSLPLPQRLKNRLSVLAKYNSSIESCFKSCFKAKLNFIFDTNPTFRFLCAYATAQMHMLVYALQSMPTRFEDYYVPVREVPVPRISEAIVHIESKKSPELLESFNCVKYTDNWIGFSVQDGFLVLTDIVNSTSLYNENPWKMRRHVKKHDRLVQELVKVYHGHIISNEGDSFGLLFQRLDEAKQFCIILQEEISTAAFMFKIRCGIHKGDIHARKLDGYKCHGHAVHEIEKMISHSCGKVICIAKQTFAGHDNFISQANFCIH